MTRFLTKQATFDKKIRQIPNSKFLQDFTFQVTKTTVQIPQSNYCSSYCFFTFQVLFKLSFWLIEGTTQNTVSLVSKSKSLVNTFLPFQQTKPSFVFLKLNLKVICKFVVKVYQIYFSCLNHCFFPRFYYCYYNFICSIFIPYCLYIVHF